MVSVIVRIEAVLNNNLSYIVGLKMDQNQLQSAVPGEVWMYHGVYEWRIQEDTYRLAQKNYDFMKECDGRCEQYVQLDFFPRVW